MLGGSRDFKKGLLKVIDGMLREGIYSLSDVFTFSSHQTSLAELCLALAQPKMMENIGAHLGDQRPSVRSGALDVVVALSQDGEAWC
jgi:hypothetical protein